MNGVKMPCSKHPIDPVNGLSRCLLFFTKINMLIFAARPFTPKTVVKKWWL